MTNLLKEYSGRMAFLTFQLLILIQVILNLYYRYSTCVTDASQTDKVAPELPTDTPSKQETEEITVVPEHKDPFVWFEVQGNK